MSRTPAMHRIPADTVTARMSSEAREVLRTMGLDPSTQHTGREGIDPVSVRPLLPKSAISAPEILNDADAYRPRPSSFSRGMRVELPGARMLFLSGTASIDHEGRTLYPGDFHAQCLRTFHNLTRLLVAEEASWHDIVRTTCYLRDIERDYDTFNDLRTFFMHSIGLDPLPASTGIQARLCRSDLLVEIEAIAMVPGDGRK
ncbi:MAG: Rid family hydrolase [Rhodospirillales bacterium]